MQFLLNPGVTVDRELPLVYPLFQKLGISVAERPNKLHYASCLCVCFASICLVWYRLLALAQKDIETNKTFSAWE